MSFRPWWCCQTSFLPNFIALNYICVYVYTLYMYIPIYTYTPPPTHSCFCALWLWRKWKPFMWRYYLPHVFLLQKLRNCFKFPQLAPITLKVTAHVIEFKLLLLQMLLRNWRVSSFLTFLLGERIPSILHFFLPISHGRFDSETKYQQ